MSKSLSQIASFKSNGTISIQSIGGKSAVGSVIASDDKVISLPTDQLPDKSIKTNYAKHLSEVSNSLQLIGNVMSKFKQFKEDPTSAFMAIGHELGEALQGKLNINNDSRWALNPTKFIQAIPTGLDEQNKGVFNGDGLKSSQKKPVSMNTITPEDVTTLSKELLKLNSLMEKSQLTDAERKKLIRTLSERKKLNVTDYQYGEVLGGYSGDYDYYLDEYKTLNNKRVATPVDDVRGPTGDESDEAHGSTSLYNKYGEATPGAIITDNIMLDESEEYKYKNISNIPYYNRSVYQRANSDITKTTSPYTIEEAKSWLTENRLLTGYTHYAGFELGTNHHWRIRIRPYESAPHGQKSCVPPLPAYILPNMWMEDELRRDETLSKQSFINTNTHGSPLRWFSFSEFLPVMSYDITFGSLQSEKVSLFNGYMDMLVGMNLSMMLNMSILDDSYGSMTKYMATYINSIYDPTTNSVAPYYNSAFEVELTILRSSGHVNYMMKFLCIPVEYAPRFDGAQEANETRVDITFSIVGYIPPTSPSESTVSVGEATSGVDPSNRNYTFKDLSKNNNSLVSSSAMSYLSNPMDNMLVSDMKWGDIIINPGMTMRGRSIGSLSNSKGTRGPESAVFGFTDMEFKRLSSKNKK